MAAPTVLKFVYLVACFGAALCFIAEEHGSITRQALSSVSAYGYTFSQTAVSDIAFAAMNVESEAAQANFVGTAHWFFHDEKLAAGSQYLIDLRQQVLDILGDTNEAGPESQDGAMARAVLGKALHSLQDFYAHTTWVEMGNNSTNPDLGVNVIADPSSTYLPCPIQPYVLSDTSRLTSGYFSVDACSPPPTQGKCVHGGLPGGFNVPCPDGLNKDYLGRPNFPKARELALQHTITFVRDLMDSVDDDASNSENALAALAAQPDPDPDDGYPSCLPYCAIFTTIPGAIIIFIIVFVIYKKTSGGGGGLFSRSAPKPRDLKNPLYG